MEAHLQSALDAAQAELDALPDGEAHAAAWRSWNTLKQYFDAKKTAWKPSNQDHRAAAQAIWQELETRWSELERLYEVESERDSQPGILLGQVSDYKYSLAEKWLAPLMGSKDEDRPFKAVKSQRAAALLGAAEAGAYSADAVDATGEGAIARYAAQTLVGSLGWTHGHGDGNHFVPWLEGTRAQDPVQMNCFDAVFYAAIKAGMCTKAAVLGVYNKADLGEEVAVALGGRGQWVSLLTRLENGGLLSGDVLIFGWDPAQHVVMSVGTGRVMSLWNKPNATTTVQVCKLSELANPADYDEIAVAPRGVSIFKP